MEVRFSYVTCTWMSCGAMIYTTKVAMPKCVTATLQPASFALQKSPETALEVANSKNFLGDHAPRPPLVLGVLDYKTDAQAFTCYFYTFT